MEEVLVIAEHDGTELSPATRDLLVWGSQLAAGMGGKLAVLIAGSQVAAMAESLANAADALYVLEGAELATYNPQLYVDAICGAIFANRPRVILLGHTYQGIELSSGIAVRLDVPLWSNCCGIASGDGGYTINRPVLGGGYESTLSVEGGGCNVMTIQRGSAPAGVAPTARSAKVERTAVSCDASKSGIKVLEETKATFTQDITKSDVLVSVGRGIGQKEKLDDYRELAAALGGSISSSRPLVDLGWLPVDFQVGLSGRTVQPKVYLACGISGSMQHLAGMRESRLIIAINQDADAPIFQYAHYGVVADVNDVLPALIEKAKAGAGKKA